MTSSNFWWQSGAGGGGYQIGNSLRFRGAQQLSRSFTANHVTSNWTYSTWVKGSGIGTLLGVGTGTYTVDNFQFIDAQQLLTLHRTSSSGFVIDRRTSGSYRDPAAWYHVLFRKTTGATRRLFINGVEVTLNPGAETSPTADGYINGASEHGVGFNPYLGRNLEGYMAECHFIDGTALDPTVFGEFNAQGVWVPKAVEGIAANYAAGFSGTFSNPENAFDGNLSTWTGNTTNGSTVYWNGNIPCTGTVRMYIAFGGGAGGSNLFSVNGIDITPKIQAVGNPGGWVDVTTEAGSALTAFQWTDVATVFDGSVRAIEVNGQIITQDPNNYGVNGFYLPFSDPDNIGKDVVNGNDFTPTGFELADPSSTDFDWMEDHPTKNYATLNPLFNNNLGSGNTMGDANLQYGDPGNSTFGHTVTSQALPDGTKTYAEFTVQQNPTQYGLFCGLMGRSDLYLPDSSDLFRVYCQQSTGTITVNGVDSGLGYGVGKVIGIAVDRTVNPIAVSVYSDGELISTTNWTGWDGSEDVFFYNRAIYSGKWYVNYGQRPFAYPPGFSSPTTAFNTVLWTGINQSPRTISGAGFEPDLVWVKNRSKATGAGHYLWDSVRGTDLNLRPDSTLAESDVSVSSNGIISTSASDGFIVKSGSASGTNVGTSGSDTYVAWCFNAGDGAPVTNTDGTITSTVKASPENGFSVVTYTGNNTAGATVGHGLGKAPSFVIWKNRTSTTNNWRLYNKTLFDANPGYSLSLNTTLAAVPGGGVTTAPDDTVLHLTQSSDLNVATEFVAYCFADTPDRVAEGRYLGTGGSNFVSTGFKPAMVLIKQGNLDGENWVMIDSARGKANTLASNSSAAEVTGSTNAVTFLSTGFSMNTSSAGVNASNGVYYYIAFAENFTPDDVKDLTAKNLEPVDITDPSEHFQTITDTGANILTSAQTAFPSGLWWIKDRANSNQHQLVDSVRGGNLALQCPASGPETAYVAPAGNSVAWCWKAGDSNVVNNDGTIQSTVSANPTAGFSIVSYTGNNTIGATVGHSLGAAPDLIIIKNRDKSSSNFTVYHSANTSSPETQRLVLNGNQVTSTVGYWNNTAPSSTVFTIGSGSGVNETDDLIAYCWHSVPGYSAFGSYSGNGSNDGTFVFTGHRPAFIMYKRTDSAGSWLIYDSTRTPYNPATVILTADSTNVESGNSTFSFDILSNGFKFRGFNTGSINASGGTYVFASFAEHPFGGSNVSPATAR